MLDQRSPRCYSAWNPPRAPYWDSGKARARRPSLQEVSLSKQFECFRNIEKMSLGGLARSNKTSLSYHDLPQLPSASANVLVAVCLQVFLGRFSLRTENTPAKMTTFNCPEMTANGGLWSGGPKNAQSPPLWSYSTGNPIVKTRENDLRTLSLNSNLSTLKHVWFSKMPSFEGPYTVWITPK